MTGFMEAAFHALLPHVEPAFVAYLGNRTLAGPPRTSRRSRTYATWPLPPMADTWLFSLSYWKQKPLQEMPGQLLGMSQSNANTGIHLRPPLWTRALAHHAWLPARTANDWTAMLTPPPSEAAALSPLFFMRGPNDPANVRKTRQGRKSMPVARRSGTRSTTSA
jgi:hypothetical protein